MKIVTGDHPLCISSTSSTDMITVECISCKWVSVKDRLPSDENTIIIRLLEPSDCCEYFIAEPWHTDIVPKGKGVLSNCVDHSGGCGSHFIEWKDIDYWMPLPPKPE